MSKAAAIWLSAFWMFWGMSLSVCTYKLGKTLADRWYAQQQTSLDIDVRKAEDGSLIETCRTTIWVQSGYPTASEAHCDHP